MLQALVEIAFSVSGGEMTWEVTAPSTVRFKFGNEQQALEFAKLARLFPISGVILLETEIIVSL
jgi:hypothetical protein